nr:hypothetical protein CFP56_40923 [Quercus suber]
MAGLGLPLVEISIGHPNNGRREDNEVESIVAKFSGTSFAHIKHLGGGSNKENLGGRTSSNKFNGVFGSKKIDSDMWELPVDKSVD